MSFTLFGVKFEISYIFACAVTLFIASDRSGIVIPTLISVILHEIGHTFCLYLFKCKIKSVKLLVGTVRIEYEENLKDFEKIISLFFGPFVNAIVAVVGLLLNNEILCAINLVLSLYNLLPIKGLDGGSIFEIIILKFLPHKLVKIVILVTSFSICLLLICFFLLNLKNLTFNYSAILFVIYLFLPLILKKLG